jgi:hypothetical protein
MEASAGGIVVLALRAPSPRSQGRWRALNYTRVNSVVKPERTGQSFSSADMISWFGHFSGATRGKNPRSLIGVVLVSVGLLLKKKGFQVTGTFVSVDQPTGCLFFSLQR